MSLPAPAEAVFFLTPPPCPSAAAVDLSPCTSYSAITSGNPSSGAMSITMTVTSRRRSTGAGGNNEKMLISRSSSSTTASTSTTHHVPMVVSPSLDDSPSMVPKIDHVGQGKFENIIASRKEHQEDVKECSSFSGDEEGTGRRRRRAVDSCAEEEYDYNSSEANELFRSRITPGSDRVLLGSRAAAILTAGIVGRQGVLVEEGRSPIITAQDAEDEDLGDDDHLPRVVRRPFISNTVLCAAVEAEEDEVQIACGGGRRHDHLLLAASYKEEKTTTTHPHLATTGPPQRLPPAEEEFISSSQSSSLFPVLSSTTDSSTSSTTPSSSSTAPSSSPPSFLMKLTEILSRASFKDIVDWAEDGESFEVKDPKKMESEVLSQFFRHAHFQSFVRQLNFYSFERLNHSRNSWVYSHPFFKRDRPELLNQLRRKSAVTASRRSTTVASVAKRRSGCLNDHSHTSRNDHSKNDTETRKLDDEGTKAVSPPPYCEQQMLGGGTGFTIVTPSTYHCYSSTTSSTCAFSASPPLVVLGPTPSSTPTDHIATSGLAGIVSTTNIMEDDLRAMRSSSASIAVMPSLAAGVHHHRSTPSYGGWYPRRGAGIMSLLSGIAAPPPSAAVAASAVVPPVLAPPSTTPLLAYARSSTTPTVHTPNTTSCAPGTYWSSCPPLLGMSGSARTDSNPSNCVMIVSAQDQRGSSVVVSSSPSFQDGSSTSSSSKKVRLFPSSSLAVASPPILFSEERLVPTCSGALPPPAPFFAAQTEKDSMIGGTSRRESMIATPSDPYKITGTDSKKGGLFLSESSQGAPLISHAQVDCPSLSGSHRASSSRTSSAAPVGAVLISRGDDSNSSNSSSGKRRKAGASSAGIAGFKRRILPVSSIADLGRFKEQEEEELHQKKRKTAKESCTTTRQEEKSTYQLGDTSACASFYNHHHQEHDHCRTSSLEGGSTSVEHVSLSLSPRPRKENSKEQEKNGSRKQEAERQVRFLVKQGKKLTSAPAAAGANGGVPLASSPSPVDVATIGCNAASSEGSAYSVASPAATSLTTNDLLVRRRSCCPSSSSEDTTTDQTGITTTKLPCKHHSCLLKLPLSYEEGDSCVEGLLAFDSSLLSLEGGGALSSSLLSSCNSSSHRSQPSQTGQPSRDHDDEDAGGSAIAERGGVDQHARVLAKNVFKLLKDYPVLARHFRQYNYSSSGGGRPCDFCQNPACYYAVVTKASSWPLGSSLSSSSSSILSSLSQQIPALTTSATTTTTASSSTAGSSTCYEEQQQQGEESVYYDDDDEYKCFDEDACGSLRRFAAFAASTLQAAHVRLSVQCALVERARRLYSSSSSSSCSCSSASLTTSSFPCPASTSFESSPTTTTSTTTSTTTTSTTTAYALPDTTIITTSSHINTTTVENDVDSFLQALVVAADKWNSFAESLAAAGDYNSCCS